MVKIQQLSCVSLKTIHKAFGRAFADYVHPFNQSLDQWVHTVERRGIDLTLSFGAFAGEELVGFTLNGVGRWRGKQTAYDTGTGVIKEYRQKGITTQIFQDSLPVLRAHHINQFLLEVIRTNANAYDLCKKVGFEVVREFDYFTANKSELVIDQKRLSNNCDIKQLAQPDWEQFKSLNPPGRIPLMPSIEN